VEHENIRQTIYKNTIEEAGNVVAETESQLSDLIESADEESALAAGFIE